MGKVNRCLRCFFILFNVFFAIFGCFLVFGTVKAGSYNNELSGFGSPNLAWSWVFAIGSISISLLGIYAGFSLKLLPLKIFAGLLAVAMLIMIVFGSIIAVTRNKVVPALQSSPDIVNVLMQDQAMRQMLEKLQLEGHCCGFLQPEDWGSRVPDSCDCSSSSEEPGVFGLEPSGCRSKPQGTEGPEKIYSRPCRDVVLPLVDFFFNLVLGIFFGLAVAALVGLLLSLLMIHQVRRHDDAGGAAIAMKGQYL